MGSLVCVRDCDEWLSTVVLRFWKCDCLVSAHVCRWIIVLYLEFNDGRYYITSLHRRMHL